MMNKVLTYGETCHENLILALGYFDAVHKGHKKVLKKAVDITGFSPCCIYVALTLT